MSEFAGLRQWLEGFLGAPAASRSAGLTHEEYERIIAALRKAEKLEAFVDKCTKLDINNCPRSSALTDTDMLNWVVDAAREALK